MNERKGKARHKVLVVDPHPVMRVGLSVLLGKEPDLVVSAEAETAAQALNLISARRPDFILVDIQLPDRSGLDLLKDIRVFHPGLPVLVFSVQDESIYAERVLRAGARGYVSKQAGGKQLIEAVRRVLEGRIYVSEKISSRIIETFSGQRAPTTEPDVSHLSDREFQVFEQIGRGESTRQIAQHLNLSAKTVEVHRANIKRKLNTRSTAELIRQAIRCAEGGCAD